MNGQNLYKLYNSKISSIKWERVEKIKPKDKNNNNSENEINNYKLLLSYKKF